LSFSYTHSGPINDVVGHQDNVTFYTASGDKTAKGWKLASDAPVRNLAGHAGMVDCVAFSPNTPEIASSSHDGTVRIWNVTTGAAVRTINAFPAANNVPASFVYCVAWSPDGKQLAASSYAKSIKVFNAADGNPVREFKPYNDKDFPQGHRDSVFCVTF